MWVKMRALPWAIALRPFGAQDASEKGSATQRLVDTIDDRRTIVCVQRSNAKQEREAGER